jgi:hypothetical protein
LGTHNARLQAVCMLMILQKAPRLLLATTALSSRKRTMELVLQGFNAEPQHRYTARSTAKVARHGNMVPNRFIHA